MMGIGRRSMGKRGISLVGVVYLVIGIVVASTHGFSWHGTSLETFWKVWRQLFSGRSSRSSVSICIR